MPAAALALAIPLQVNPLGSLFGAHSDVVLWVVGLTAGLIVFYVLAAIVSRLRGKKSVETFGMSFDDLDRMTRSGLLSAEEQQRVRAALSRQWMERQAPATPPATVGTLMAQATAAEMKAPEKTGPAQTGADPSGGAIPPDEGAEASLEALAREGALSAREAAALREILRRRQG